MWRFLVVVVVERLGIPFVLGLVIPYLTLPRKHSVLDV
jgi:hypothetical protein